MRPTSDRVREAIFDVLEHRVVLSDLAVYDLYAGTGALGIEALSRGSPHATFVEAAWRTAATIRDNLERLGVPADRWKVVHARVEPWLKKARGEPARFLLLLDPPYATAEHGPVLDLVGGWDARDDMVPDKIREARRWSLRVVPPVPSWSRVTGLRREDSPPLAAAGRASL